ncbi:hypothetical protein ACN27F_10715 [Solwaraspora sp. WMMB335]|uniref:hypothetical protein n=1 Tax=Solwaraspora sp. WMMB335 TaxID=3404118 RepID=UPI003B93FBCC
MLSDVRMAVGLSASGATSTPAPDSPILDKLAGLQELTWAGTVVSDGPQTPLGQFELLPVLLPPFLYRLANLVAADLPASLRPANSVRPHLGEQARYSG